MKKYPLISVIIVTYNRANLLSKTVKSLLSQDYKNVELVVVDGNSKDNTRGVIKSISDPRVKYHRQDSNSGILSGRNKGLDLAKGGYLCFLDDDDELVRSALSTAVKEFERAPKNVGMIWFDCFDSKTGKETGRGIEGRGYIKYSDLLCERIYGEFWPFFKRDAIGSARFNERLWGAEGNLWLRLYKKSDVLYIPKALRIYHRDHGGNVCKFENQLKKADKFVLNNLAFLEEFGEEQKKLCPKAYARRLSVLGFWQIMAGDTKEGRNTLKKSLKINIAPKPLVLYLSSAFIGKEKLARIYSKIASSKLLGRISG